MSLALSCALSLALSACGGGGGASNDSASTSSTGGTGSTGTAPSTASSPAPDVGASAASTGSGTSPSTPNSGPVSTAPAGTPSNSSTVADVKALGVSASLAMEGIAERPVVANAVAASGNTYYVDSATGNDANDGLDASAGAALRGPWRSLARVLQAPLAAGDGLVLACGGVWNETLRLPASGTLGRPIVVSAASSSCKSPPVIDGGVLLTPASWVLHQGKVYKTALASTPLQITAATTTLTWTEAHHPNRGHLASDPTSPYLSTAADSELVKVENYFASNALFTGPDLTLPAGTQLAGARVGVRIHGWWYEDHTVTSHSGNRLGFASPTLFPISAGRGYYLKGQLWMADSDGEWYHDATAKQLYAHMPAGTVPSTPLLATVLATGIDLQGRDHVVIDGLAIRRTGVGVDLRGTQNVAIRNTSVTDTAGVGVDASGTTGTTVESCAFTRTGDDAVSGWRYRYTMNSAMTVRNNVIRDSGVLMSGDTVLSQPARSGAAIYAGPRSTVSGNVIINAGYIGILAQAGSLIEKNFIYGACSVLDDCGGIYTQNINNNNVIRGNTVVRSRGAIAGKPASEASSQAQGIYLDESVTGTLVEDNTVVDADNGILVHVSSNNIIRGNRLYGNRSSQIWLQADFAPDKPTRNVVDNLVVDNLIAPISPGSVGIKLETTQSSTAGFGTIDRNRYYDRASPVAVLQGTASGVTLFSAAGWQKAAAASLPAGRDAGGSAISLTPYTSYRANGGNLIPNNSSTPYTYGWNPWNATAPAGQMTSGNCAVGPCLNYVAGGSPGLVASPNFSVVKGQWYRLSFDVAASSDGVNLAAAIRRGGGGSNGYESVGVRDLAITANRSWARHTTLIQSSVTIHARDPVTLDNGARFDIGNVPVGQAISLANVELVAITPDSTAALSGALINAGATAKSWDCPYASNQVALCSKFKRLADDGTVGWPATVAAYSALLIYAQEPTLLDSDGDGIADIDDQCPGTPKGSAVNAVGCPMTLR